MQCISIVILIVLNFKELSHDIYTNIEINFYDCCLCLQMKFEETKDKLEKYRKKKLQEEAQNNRRQYLWDIVTLRPLRRNIGSRVEQVPDNDHNIEGNDEIVEEDDDNSKERRWTKIDWAILFVKILVWASMQMIFVKIEFGSVFFLVSCILLMTSNLGKR